MSVSSVRQKVHRVIFSPGLRPVEEESSPDEDAIALKACENKDTYKISVSKSAEKEESTKV